jgi:hypothetical protein
MRYDRSFNPEWGCVAPAPSAMRTARLIAVAVTIGATVGAATVWSVLDRAVPGESVAARTLVASNPAPLLRAGASAAAEQPVGAQRIKSPAEAENVAGQKAPTASADGAAAGPQSTPPMPQHPTDPTVFAETIASKETYSADASNSAAAVAPDPALAPKQQTKKSRLTSRTAPRADGWRYDARRHDRYFDARRYRNEPRYGYERRYDAGALAWSPYY